MPVWAIVLIVVVAVVIVLISILSIFTSWMWLQKRVKKYVARGDSVFTIKVQGGSVQQKKHKLIDLCEQNGYILAEESQETSTSISMSTRRRRRGVWRMGSSHRSTGSSHTSVVARVLTFKKR